MGYYTSYKIVSVEPVESVAAFERAFTLHSVGRTAMPWFGVGVGSGNASWYEHEVHVADAMIESGVSKVVLHGEGEEHDDVWDKTFGVDEFSRVWCQKTQYELVAKKPDAPAQIATSAAGWSRVAEHAARTAVAAGGRPRIPGCVSNECAIRNKCTGHLHCPGGLYRG